MSLQSIKISVIIPCYNVSEYVMDAVNSVFIQTYSNFEIICIDNNSTDGTYELLSRLSKEDDRIKLYKEKRKGAPFARNKGIAESSGEWLQFLDADDILLSGKFEEQLKIIEGEGSESIGFVSSECNRTYLKRKDKHGHIGKYGDDYKNLFMNSLGNTCSNLYNAECVKSIEGWNTSMTSSQETDLMFRILKLNKRPLYLYESLAVIRERESGQISQQNPIKKWRTYVDVRVQIVKYLRSEKHDYWKENKDFYLNSLLSSILVLMKYSPNDWKNYIDLFDKSYSPQNMFGVSKNKTKLINAIGIKLFLYISSLKFKLKT